MSTQMKLRWAAVGCIWILALAVTFWNGSKVDQVAASRQSNEQARRENDFLRQNANRLADTMASHDARFLAVESMDLGIVAMRSRLMALAAAFDLADVKIHPEMSQMGEDQVPCEISLRGPLGQAVGFVTALGNYPYLTVRRLGVSAAAGPHEMVMQIGFLFRYRIGAPIPAPEVLPHVTTHRIETHTEAL